MGRPLREQVVVVTGASSGVGRAIARAFGRARARVGLVARTREALENAAREVRDSGGEALVLPLDVSALGSHEISLAALFRVGLVFIDTINS